MPIQRIIRIGRRQDNDYRLSSSSASANHALLIVGSADRHLVIDHNSSNGTRVAGFRDGERIKQSTVHGDDEVFFGEEACVVGQIIARTSPLSPPPKEDAPSAGFTPAPAATPTNLPDHRIVGFTESLELFFKNYGVFIGRSSRGSFWWWQVWSLAIPLTLTMGLLPGGTNIEAAVAGLYLLATIVPALALCVRRLHDVGRSGLWLLLGFTGIGYIVLLFWFIRPGDRGENVFGPDVEAGKRIS